MIRKTMPFILLIFWATSTCGQTSGTTNKHYIETLIGVNFDISRKDDITSTFSLNNKTNIIPMGFSYSYFPLKNWGLFTDMYLSVSASKKSNPPFLESKDSYIVNSDWNEYDNTITGLFGISYRWENDKFNIRPRIGMGFTGRNVNTYRGTLKEKDSNSVYYAHYNWKSKHDDIGCVSFALNASYKLSKYIHLTCGAEYLRHLKRNTLEYTLRDAYENKIIEENSYQAPIGQYLNVKAGISIALGHRKK